MPPNLSDSRHRAKPFGMMLLSVLTSVARVRPGTSKGITDLLWASVCADWVAAIPL